MLHMGLNKPFVLLLVVVAAVVLVFLNRNSDNSPGLGELRSPPLDDALETLSIPDQAQSTIASESEDDSARTNNDHSDVGQIAKDQVVDELVGRLISAGDLGASIDDLIDEFESQPVGGVNESRQTTFLSNEFASQASLGDYYLDSLECRETLCRGYVVAVDGRSFDYEDLTELSVALLDLKSVELEATHISGFGKPSVQVFFSNLDGD